MPDHLQNRLIFIAGPTASGKSALAIELAQRLGGEIVNADAMQVYADLQIVTARPTTEDGSMVPHHLYGFLDGRERCSAGRWAGVAVEAVSDIHQRGACAILVGGTGLYFRALETGLSPIPDIDPAIRELGRARHREIGPDAFRAEVLMRDPAMERLPTGDTQRLIRAWEVFEETGKPLSYFQALPPVPLLQEAADKVVLVPDRENIYCRCDKRAEAMMGAGAIEEVEALLARRLDPELPVMEALGVPEISRFLRGQTNRDNALGELQQATRRFAKRQLTWFRNQTPGWHRAENTQAAQLIVS